MNICKIEDRIYYKSDLLENVAHGFTTKCGGFSSGKIDGLNLGFRCGDNAENVNKNYMIVAQDLEMPYESMVTARQTHSVNIRIVTQNDKGMGVSRESNIMDTDGLITNCANIPLVIFYADCVPILLLDVEKSVVSAIHSGWRGTVGSISGNAVDIMREKFGSDAKNIKAVIGPSIGKCCFEVGAEVAKQFDNDLVFERGNGKYTVDLWQANRRILLRCGLKDENIDVFEMCTSCNKDILYSYRCHGDATGRMGAFIMLRK